MMLVGPGEALLLVGPGEALLISSNNQITHEADVDCCLICSCGRWVIQAVEGSYAGKGDGQTAAVL
jgi:hypothetical protein